MPGRQRLIEDIRDHALKARDAWGEVYRQADAGTRDPRSFRGEAVLKQTDAVQGRDLEVRRAAEIIGREDEVGG